MPTLLVRILILVFLLICGISNTSLAQQADRLENPTPQETEAGRKLQSPKQKNGQPSDEEQLPEPKLGQPKFNPTLIQEGVIAFQSYCVSCHDAQTSLKESKSLVDWRATVAEMSEKEDADIPASKHEAIAVYLASIGDSAKQSQASKASKDSKKSDGDKQSSDAGKADKKLDAALVEKGKTAFQSYCVSCHDAQKSLEVTKSYSAWLSTTRRMAEKDGAQIPTSSHESIATYLASLASAGKASGEGKSEGASASNGMTVSGTISPWLRSGGDTNIELPGFFGDVWVGVNFSSGPVSIRATTCNTCHSDGAQLGRFDLVEATIRLDMNKLAGSDCERDTDIRAYAEAGRFVVPFGAYYQQVNPGVDRGVTRPLIYNMGQRVRPNDLGEPVLPMPYSDEGALLNFKIPFGEGTTIALDAYAVNGLAGPNSINYYKSRDYTDNNRTPAIGGRVSVGGQNLQLGASYMGGRLNSDLGSGPLNQGLNYTIFGTDMVFQWKDRLRFQAEFAQRDSDRFGVVQDPIVFQERVSGSYLQSEYLLLPKKRLSLFFRYDTQLTHAALPPTGSSLTTGDFRVQRLTYGFNKTLKGGSLLMVDFERWYLPDQYKNIDLFGVRWAMSF